VFWRYITFYIWWDRRPFAFSPPQEACLVMEGIYALVRSSRPSGGQSLPLILDVERV